MISGAKSSISRPPIPDVGARLTFDLSRPGRMACTLPACDVPQGELPPAVLLRRELNLPELSQVDVLITDSGISPEMLVELEQAGVHVEVAKV